MRFFPWFMHAAIMALMVAPHLAQSADRSPTTLRHGTGFAINVEGHIITSAHVVGGCDAISVLTPTGEKIATLVATDADIDLAALKTAFTPKNIALLRPPQEALEIQEETYIAGFHAPQAQPPAGYFINTRVNGLTNPEGDPRWIQLSHAILSGNSGGAVIDSGGHVVGVVTAIAEQRPATAFVSEADVVRADIAVALPALRDFLDRHQIPYAEGTARSPLDSATLRDIAAAFTMPVRCLRTHGEP